MRSSASIAALSRPRWAKPSRSTISGIFTGLRRFFGIETNNASPKQAKTMSFTISARRISPADPTLVIAEIGVNHDGSLSRALELVDHAHRAQADAVKLQIFRAKTLMHASTAFA